MKNKSNQVTVTSESDRHLKKRKRGVLLIVVVILLLTVGLALAGGGPSEPRSLTAGGGSQVSSGALSLSSALGQPVAGSVGTGGLIGADGFWVGEGVQALPTPPPGADSFLYLPITIR